MENVNQNMHTAMEYNPEAFAEVRDYHLVHAFVHCFLHYEK